MPFWYGVKSVSLIINSTNGAYKMRFIMYLHIVHEEQNINHDFYELHMYIDCKRNDYISSADINRKIFLKMMMRSCFLRKIYKHIQTNEWQLP